MGEARSQTVAGFLEGLASAEPVPGGGSVAALSGSLGAALGLMVCAIASKKGTSAAVASVRERILPLRERFLTLADEDAAAFSQVMAAYRLPKDDPVRQGQIQAGLLRAASVPLDTAVSSRDLLKLLVELAPLGTKPSISDVGVGVILARAALEAALINVDTNLASITDESVRKDLAARRDALLAQGQALSSEALGIVRARL
jgi:formiminotetrahydrofolate cyclodeaminase